MAQCVATVDELKAFETEKSLTPSLKGVLVEIATTGVIRYPWKALLPLLCFYVENVFEAFPIPNAERDVPRLCEKLKALSDPPFTLQRLTELLLEPKKQYASGEKLAAALEKLISVTTLIPITENPPERPLLDSLPKVNENPPPVEFQHAPPSEIFKGFLESKKLNQENGSVPESASGLAATLFTVTDE